MVKSRVSVKLKQGYILVSVNISGNQDMTSVSVVDLAHGKTSEKKLLHRRNLAGTLRLQALQHPSPDAVLGAA